MGATDLLSSAADGIRAVGGDSQAQLDRVKEIVEERLREQQEEIVRIDADLEDRAQMEASARTFLGSMIDTSVVASYRWNGWGPEQQASEGEQVVKLQLEQRVAGRTVVFVPNGAVAGREQGDLDVLRNVPAVVQFPNGSKLPVTIIEWDPEGERECIFEIRMRGEIGLGVDPQLDQPAADGIATSAPVVRPDWSDLPYEIRNGLVVPKSSTGWSGARTNERPNPALLVSQFATLRNTTGTSDKVYVVMLVREKQGAARARYRVVAAWGRFGQRLSWQDKLAETSEFTAANRQMNALIDQKTSEGYWVAAASAVPLPDGFIDMSGPPAKETLEYVAQATGARPKVPDGTSISQVVAIDNQWVAVEEVDRKNDAARQRSEDRLADLRRERVW